jgi:phosphatidylglycerol:prolipoprotein diacylglycerol transferase
VAQSASAITTQTGAQSETPAGKDNLLGLLERARRPVLAATYWFNPAAEPEAQPYAVTIRFTGRRAGSEQAPEDGDQFVHEQVVERVVPGSGPIALTARVRGVNAGEWNVTAGALETVAVERRGRLQRFQQRREQQRVNTEPFAGTTLALPRLWLNWAPPVNVEGTAAPIPTRLEPFIRIPGTLPYIWITLVIVGMIVALITQAQLIARIHLPVWTVTFCTILALAAGAVGAKVWHVVKHRNHPDEQGVAGWTIQGMIVGATATAIVAFWVARVPLGVALDASAPGLMFGMAIGRVGCFLAGCCGGPPTAARWAIWSSDQHVGARRVPTQLMESLFCLLGGLLTLAVFLWHGPANGAIFVAAVAAYTLFREWLLRLRAEKYETPLPQLALPVASTLALIGSLVYIISARGT